MKKIFLGLFVFVAGIVLASNLIKVKAAATVTLTDGVSIRTDAHAGMKFQATVSEEVEGATYGIIFGKGEVANLTHETQGAVSSEVTEVDENKQYRVTMVKFPESAYVQDITARAYIKDAEGNYTYSENSVTRNLAQLALAAKNKGMADADEEGNPNLIANVEEYIGANYKKVWVDGQNNVHITNPIYETVPANIEKAFVADWNAKFGTEWTEYAHATWAESAKAGYGEGTGMTANSNTDCSGTNAYEFFITDEETSAKWAWLLDFLLAYKGGTVHPNRQIQALRNNGSFSDSYGGGLQQFAHLSRSLQNFFDAEGTDVYGSGIDVIIKDLSIYSQIEKFNNTVYASEQVFIKQESEYTLESLSKTAYNFDGYKVVAIADESEKGLAQESYVIEAASAVLKPSFTPINYTIKYMNGENEITELADSYTIEKSVVLPAYELEGYDFLGWYDNSEFSGNAVTEIVKGTYGDKVYYANLEETKAKVNVTFDTQGGYLALYPSVDAAIADFLNDYNTARGKSHTVDTFYALGSWGEISDASLFLYNANYKAKWAWLVDYIAGVASDANKPAWTVFNNYTSQAELNAANGNHIYRIAYELRGWVGQKQYTKNGNFMTDDYSSASAQAAYVTAVTLPNEYVYSNDPVTLPTPIRENHTFLGWIDSEGNPVTQYPGYTENPGDIKYTATWKVNYATVNVTYDANGGKLPMSYDPNAKIATTYNNVGGASGTYFCDSSITSNNSLRWQYKVLLQYDETLNAYKVVCLDAAKASANNAASAAGVTWTHALSNSGSNISTQYTVGQYIYFGETPVKGANNLSYVVLDSAEAVEAYQFPTTYSTTYVNATTLITPIREGYTFVGWKSSVDGSIVTEYPAYIANPGDITYTAQWEQE